MSASAYYQCASGQRSRRRIEDERLLGGIIELHGRNYRAYGYRRCTWPRRAGETVGRDRVERLMRQAGIQGAKRRGKPWRGPLELVPDKPWDAEDPEDVPLSAAREGRVDSLTHDAAYFKAIEQASIHGGLLDGLRNYYPRR